MRYPISLPLTLRNALQMALPGDRVMPIPESGQLRVGQGFRQSEGHLVSCKAGVVHQTVTGKVWMQGIQKRYISAADDLVIGTITQRQGEVCPAWDFCSCTYASKVSI